MMNPFNTYDDYAVEYSNYIASIEAREADKSMAEWIAATLLDYAGDVSKLKVLDAGCGEGYISRKLASLGAVVTAVDVSSKLIEIAQKKPFAEIIDYFVADLSKPLDGFTEDFDLVVSNMVIMDVYDYQGFVATISSVLKKGCHAVLSMHNPYNSVRHERVANYFDSGKTKVYEGFKQATGVSVTYHHRTLEEYIATFRDRGFYLRSLSDLRPTEEMMADPNSRGEYIYHFPLIMVLEFEKVA